MTAHFLPHSGRIGTHPRSRRRRYAQLPRKLWFERLEARLIPTPKNKPCLDFLRRSGMSRSGDYEFSWDLRSKEYPLHRALTLHFEELSEA